MHEPSGESQQPQQQQAPLFDLGEAIGGRRGIIDASVPGTVLVIVNVFASLRWAIIASVLAAVVISALRVIRREPLRQAASGVLGIGLAALLAAYTGHAKTFFLPGILISGGYAVATLVSILVGHPVMGYVAQALDKRFLGWRGDPRLRRRATYATGVWVLVFLARFAVMGWLYLHNHTSWLATAKLAMGWPPWAVGVLASMLLLQPRNEPHAAQPDEAAAQPG